MEQVVAEDLTMKKTNIFDAVDSIKKSHGGYKTWRVIRMLANIQLTIVELLVFCGLISIMMSEGYEVMQALMIGLLVSAAVFLPLSITIDGIIEPLIMTRILKGKNVTFLDINNNPINDEAQIIKYAQYISWYMSKSTVWDFIQSIIVIIVGEVVLVALTGGYLLLPSFLDGAILDMIPALALIAFMALIIVLAKVGNKKHIKRFNKLALEEAAAYKEAQDLQSEAKAEEN